MAKKKKKKNKKEKDNKEFKGDVIQSLQSVLYLYDRKLDKAFVQHDLSNEQYRILTILKSAPVDGLSLKQIRESLPNQTSNTTRLVDKLNQKSLLTKKASKIDKRQLRINMTAKGNQVLSSAEADIKTINSSLKKSISQKNGEVVFNSMKKISKILVD